ncbi:MAG: hypothetical protein WKG32_11685 [Gemmatimonadaceae bacterium]
MSAARLAASAMLASLGALAAVGACSSNRPAGVPDEAPSIAGTITQVSAQQGGSGERRGSVLIEVAPADISGSDKSSVTVTRATRVYVREGGTLRAATFGELYPGQRAEAWFTGPVAESYPTQARAAVIVVAAP